MTDEVERLYDALQKTQEPQGYFFNKDREKVFELLQGLLTNKKRYGYMACPCRLATGRRESDQDIICPCVYRAADVEQYGSCYCNLYVSEGRNAGRVDSRYVPERRPAEKLGF